MNRKFLIAVAGILSLVCALSTAREWGWKLVTSHQSADSAQASAPQATSWLSDPDDAAAAAVASDKDLLVEFEATIPAADLVSPASAVFDSEGFRRSAGEKFVLVRLRSSADAPADTAARVAAWGERLGVTQFPAVVLLDPRGRPYADAVWRDTDVEASIRLLHRLGQAELERDGELARAKRAEGIDRARHLDAALKVVGRFATAAAYVDVMREIMALDKANSAGLKAKYASVVAGIDIDLAIQSEVYPMIDKGDLAGAIARIDRLIADADPTASQRQLLLAFKGQLYFSLHDTREATHAFDEALRIDPASDTAAKVLAARRQVMGDAS